MTDILIFINGAILIAISLFFLVLGISSFNEKEYRAAVIALVSFVLNVLFWGWFLYVPHAFQTINILVISGLGLFGLISLMKFFPDRSTGRNLSKADQYDERDTMFARNNLQHHPKLMKKYYALHPENESTDRQIHQKPEFGEKEQVYHDKYTAPCYEAAFEYLEKSIPLSTGAMTKQKMSIDPIQFCKTITDTSKFYGASDIGFLKLKSHHFYSHKGRHAEKWGNKTDQTHKTAIVIVIPMRVEMIKKGPTSCVLQESAQKYVEAAKISNILAGYIRNFGYEARAHNDGNYDTLCVPIAVEAGLGELGRMGILMHRTHGPCVRLAIVTTDLELPDSTHPESCHMEEFCKICKKCADNCPSGSITHGNEPYSRNVRHWSIHQEKCFSYWKTIGSDCGFCISVCPYTKPDTLIHKFVKFYISRNTLNQKIALFMDDLLYGRHRKIAKTNPKNMFIQT
ncbi:MAG: 4Fe-4S dicluster domain-containing protein [Deltaproteobacteria bacterium]|nr:4Fe-4S dicluster domain-containing protein [Deltaproteobacteria bacterium]